MARTLWLLRHGDAEPHGARDDFERRLTARGERQATRRRTGAARASACASRRVFTSPRVRALDTARLACAELGSSRSCTSRSAAASTTRDAAELLAAHRAGGARCCSSATSPTSRGLVAALTGARIEMKKGGLAAIARRRSCSRCYARARSSSSLGSDSSTARAGRRRRRASSGLGREAVADAEVGVDVAPVGRDALELLAQLAHEHVDRAVAADHRVAPQPLVDELALEHAPARGRRAARSARTRAASGRCSRRARRPGTGRGGSRPRPRAPARPSLDGLEPAAAAHDRLDARDQLLGMAGLGQPVVGAEPQPAHALGDASSRPCRRRRRARAARRRGARATPSQVGPITARSTTIAREPHRHDRLRARPRRRARGTPSRRARGACRAP